MNKQQSSLLLLVGLLVLGVLAATLTAFREEYGQIGANESDQTSSASTAPVDDSGYSVTDDRSMSPELGS